MWLSNMNEAKNKNYKLIIDINGEEYEIIRETLKEIDDFTSYFIDENSLINMICKEYSLDLKSCRVYIESSKGSIEKVVYFNQRPIAIKENELEISNIIKKKEKKEVLNCIVNKYNLKKYISELSFEELKNIPVFKVYSALSHDDSNQYISSLSSLINEYKDYRNLALNLFDDKDYKGLSNKLDRNKKREIEETCNEVYETILPVISTEKLENSFIEVLSSEEDDVLGILSNDNLEPYQKYEELDKLLQDEEKYRKYIEKYQYLINGKKGYSPRM